MMRLFLIAVAIAAASTAARATDYPTVRELENGLGYSPGAQIPKDVPARNRGWHIFSVHTRALGNGEYDVRVKLR